MGVILSISLEYDFHINSTTGLTTDSASGINRKERHKRVFPLRKQNQTQTAFSQTTHVTGAKIYRGASIHRVC